MDEMFLQFPVEISEKILECNELSFHDLCSVASTCSKLKDLIDSNQQLWKRKFFQSYPRLERIYRQNELMNNRNWVDECKTRFMYSNIIKTELEHLMNTCYMKDELEHYDYSRFMVLVAKHEIGSLLVIDELMNIIHDTNVNINLTKKYYAEKVLRLMRQHILTEEWQHLTLGPPEEQILEKGAVIVAQWCQPTMDVTYEDISKAFDDLSDEVVKEISVLTNGEHPILKTSIEKRRVWGKYNITDNKWSKSENKIVLEAVSNVLFHQMKFYGSQEFYYYPDNSFINKVLEEKQGIPITLALLYEAVTRRLGIKCEAVSFPGHFLLRWRSSYRTDENNEYSYVDVFNGGQLFTKSSCPRFENYFPSRCPMSDVFKYRAATVEEVVRRMANNLEVANRQRTSMVGRKDRLKSVLELLYMLNPKDLNFLLQLTRFYMYLNMEIVHPLEQIQTLLDSGGIDIRGIGQAHHMLNELNDYQCKIKVWFQNYKMVIKSRSPHCNVKYSIGMVMFHRLYHYKCVIYGWDEECKESDDWMKQMGVQNLERGNKQPFYQVLVNDGSQRYAAEDNLIIGQDENMIVEHHLIGRYFSEFCGTYYKPNELKSREYPDDMIVTKVN